jgi:glycosyltransferase involved in cell wall biosynthesis
MPRVSIITALHNKGHYIGQTVHSVLNQTMLDWELIVVENGSTDDGPDIVRQISDPRIRLVVSPRRGPGAARNFGLDHACGEWVLFLDADDLIEPEHLAALLRAGEGQRDVAVIAGAWKEFSDNTPEIMLTHRPATFGFKHKDLLARALSLAPWILHAAIIKRSNLSAGNRWPEQLDGCPDEDTAFWFSLLLDSPVMWTDSAHASYRRFAVNSRSGFGDLLIRTKGYAQIMEYNLAIVKMRGVELPSVSFGHISMMFEVTYRAALISGNEAAAAFALENAIFWLKKCPSVSWKIRLRKWLGIPFVNHIKLLLQSKGREGALT